MRRTVKTLALSLAVFTTTAFASPDQYVDTFSENATLSSDWVKVKDFVIENGRMHTNSWGWATLPVNTVTVGSEYEVSMTLPGSGVTHTQPLMFGFKDTDSSFYTARVKRGQWGRISISKHASIYGNVTNVYTSPEMAIDTTATGTLKIKVEGGNITLMYAGELITSVVADFDHNSHQVGVFGAYNGPDYAVDDFVVATTNNQPFHTDFSETMPAELTPLSGDWVVGYHPDEDITGLKNLTNEGLIIADGVNTQGGYSVEMVWSNEDPQWVQNSPRVVFGYTDVNSPFYSLSSENGGDTEINLYRHNDGNDLIGTVVATGQRSGMDIAHGEQALLGTTINEHGIFVFVQAPEHHERMAVLHHNIEGGLFGPTAGILMVPGEVERPEFAFVRSLTITK